jgi:uncharacterized protein
LVRADVPGSGRKVARAALQRLLVVLAREQGALLNASRLGAELGLSAPTVRRYVGLFENLLLVRRLAPIPDQAFRRLVRSEKVYVRDSGLVHALLGISSEAALAEHAVAEKSWEGFVIESLICASPRGTRASFYRVAGGAEIPLVLDFPSGERWAVEIERVRGAKPGRGFYSACDDVEPHQLFVVHSGVDHVALGPDVEAIGLRELVQALGRT